MVFVANKPIGNFAAFDMPLVCVYFTILPVLKLLLKELLSFSHRSVVGSYFCIFSLVLLCLSSNHILDLFVFYIFLTFPKHSYTSLLGWIWNGEDLDSQIGSHWFPGWNWWFLVPSVVELDLGLDREMADVRLGWNRHLLVPSVVEPETNSEMANFGTKWFEFLFTPDGLNREFLLFFLI